MHALLFPLLILGLADVPTVAPEIAVVCPAEFRPAMQPWVDRRTNQGRGVQFVSNLGTPVEIRERIRTLANGGKLQYVVLVGDAPKTDGGSAPRAKLTPTFRIPARMMNVLAGIDELDSDNPYGDLNDDGVPELAVGRLPARSAGELSAMLKRILAYEDSHDFGPWRARINFVTGQGCLACYGDWIDAEIEAVARKAVAWELPRGYEFSMTNPIWESPFCPDPRKFHDYCLERLNEGCLFWVFMGHGSPRSLQWAVFPDGGTPILQCDDGAHIHCGSTPPMVLLFCCYTGALTNSDGCLAEDLMRLPEGPVAVLGGSSETSPYGMAVMGRQMIRQYFENRSETLGLWLLSAKRETVAGYQLPFWSLLNAATTVLAPAFVNPKAERLEHLQLFNLFGDPTMKLYHPREVKLQLAKQGVADRTLKVDGESPVDGTATVELLTPLDRLPLPQRDEYDDSPKGRAMFDARYRAANHPSLSTTTATVQDGRFSTEMILPAEATGICRLRVYVQGQNDCAVGACDITASGPPNAPAQATRNGSAN